MFKLGFAMLVSVSSGNLYAQYYERPYEEASSRFIHAGFFHRNFEPRFTNTFPDSQKTGYNRIMPTIGFRQGLVDVTFGYTRFTIRGENKTSIFAGVAVGKDFPVVFSPTSALLIPVQVSSDYTRTDNTGSDIESFNIGSVGIGAGLKYHLKHQRFEFILSGTESVHLSFEAFNTGTGFSAATIGEALFVFRHVIGLDGITLGYRFRYQTWNMGNDKFDYKSLSHGAFLGVIF